MQSTAKQSRRNIFKSSEDEPTKSCSYRGRSVDPIQTRGGGTDIAQHNISYPPVSKSYVSAPLQYMCVTGPPKLIRTWGLDLLVGVV